jgi:hypothetical protein
LFNGSGIACGWQKIDQYQHQQERDDERVCIHIHSLEDETRVKFLEKYKGIIVMFPE